MFEEMTARDNINMSDEELYSFFNKYCQVNLQQKVRVLQNKSLAK